MKNFVDRIYSTMSSRSAFTTRNNTNNNMHGGNTFDNTQNDDKEALYKYKARKYHYKIQQSLKQMLANGQTVPAGYEKYLMPFSD